VVVVVEENHSYGDIVGNPQAPYFNALAGAGVSLTSLRAITHPSEPNYLALFSGSTQGVTSDACPLSFAGLNLGSELRAHGLTFTGFSEGLPRTGSTVCAAGAYGRKHAPWTDFTDLPGTVNQPLTAFPSDFARLPTVAFVIPNLDHDMHDGTIGEADGWLREHLGNYASWAVSHQSLLIVTWDEDDFSQANQIPTFVVGAGVRAHRVTTATTLYSVLRLIEDRYELPRLGSAATAAAISLG
jgi:acid phosphatase